MANSFSTGVRCPRDPQRWLVLPWSPTADVHEVVRHFLRATLPTDATDLEHLAYYETYTAALASACERRSGTEWCPITERWYRDLRSALTECLDQYRPSTV